MFFFSFIDMKIISSCSETKDTGGYLNASTTSPESGPVSPEPGAALDSSYNDRRIYLNTEDYYNQDNEDEIASSVKSPVARPAPPVQYKGQTSLTPQVGPLPAGGPDTDAGLRFRTESPRSQSSVQNQNTDQSPLPTSPPPRPPPVSRQFIEEGNEEEINVWIFRL